MHKSILPIALMFAISGLACHASADDSQKPAARLSPKLRAALRDAETVSFVSEEFRIDNKPAPKNLQWRQNTVRECVTYLFDCAKIKLVDSGGDLTFTVRTSVVTLSASYGLGLPGTQGGSSHAIKRETGAIVKGTMNILRDKAVVGTIQFEGRHNPPGSITLGGIHDYPDPISAAAGNSGLVPDFLELLVAARGQSMLQRIINDNRMNVKVYSDWANESDFKMRAYQSVFDVLAKSREQWAKKMLSELAKDKESPTAKRFAKEAMQKQKWSRAKRPSKQ